MHLGQLPQTDGSCTIKLSAAANLSRYVASFCLAQGILQIVLFLACQMSDIKRIDTNTYVTVQGEYAVVNEGSGYAIINIRTKHVIARNISSFLDCVKTLEYIIGDTESQKSTPIQASAVLSEPDVSSKSVQLKTSHETKANHETKKLDELDLALLKSIVSYFEKMPDKIRHYHRDHHASQEEAEVIASYYLKTASIVRGVKTLQGLEELLKSLETLKEKISRYQHNSYKYRWSTSLEKEVLVKLKKMIDTLKN